MKRDNREPVAVLNVYILKAFLQCDILNTSLSPHCLSSPIGACTFIQTGNQKDVNYCKRKNELARIPGFCRALKRIHFENDKVIVIDEEKYLTINSNVENCPGNVKYKKKAKFGDKVLVWCAISTRISKPYAEQISCLTKLVDFIHQNHAQDDVLDRLSSHYVFNTQNWKNAQNIPFAPKNDNYSNLTQAQTIKGWNT
ncbi:hypothetical protein FQR65_LT00404 [Abscondita terminalis]|nr:hypothetical protein FQR65_LT00404 [Abscondita terminalis]